MSGALPYWLDADDPLAWDTLWVNDEMWPGVASVSVITSRKVDVAKTKGSDGANLKDEGYDPAKVTISILCYSENDWRELQLRLADVHPRRPGGPRDPINISHPVSDLLGVNQVYIHSIKTGGFDPKNHWFILNMEAMEWFPAPKPVQKAAGSGGSAGTDYDALALLKGAANKVKNMVGSILGYF